MKEPYASALRFKTELIRYLNLKQKKQKSCAAYWVCLNWFVMPPASFSLIRFCSRGHDAVGTCDTAWRLCDNDRAQNILAHHVSMFALSGRVSLCFALQEN
jgi:hypothetical protein